MSESAVAVERESLQQRLSDWLDLPLAILALIWVGLLVMELAVPLSPEVSERIIQIEIAIWLVFAVDFLVEFALAPDKARYLRSNLLAALSVALPFVRAVRVVRLAVAARSVSLIRLVTVGNHATVAIAEVFSRHRFQYVVSLVAVTTLLGATGVYFFERDIRGSPYASFWDALWWAAALATTINIGTDPVTAEGRVIGLLLRAVALAVFGYITASIASYLVEERVAGRRDGDRMEVKIAHLAREVRRLQHALDRMETIQRERDGSGGAPNG